MTLRPDPSFLEYMSAVAVWRPQVDSVKERGGWTLMEIDGILVGNLKKNLKVFHVEISPNPKNIPKKYHS